jgi:hypothetical protein
LLPLLGPLTPSTRPVFTLSGERVRRIEAGKSSGGCLTCFGWTLTTGGRVGSGLAAGTFSAPTPSAVAGQLTYASGRPASGFGAGGREVIRPGPGPGTLSHVSPSPRLSGPIT